MTPPLSLFNEGQSTGGYWRNFSFAAEPGSVWLQEVETEITCFSGDEPWLRFSDRYGEFFVLDPAGGLGGSARATPLLDLHAFDVLQDGWGRAGLRRWLARQPGQRRRPATLLTVCKRFRLGPGALEGVELPASCAAEGAFDYLTEGPNGPPAARLEFCLDPRAEVELPSPHRPQGLGRFSTDDRWEAVERYRFSYPNLSGQLVSASDYALLSRERTAS